MTREILAGFLSLALLVPAAPAVEPAPGQAPGLRVEDPFIARIWRLDVDASGRHLVTGSADKAVAVWSLDRVEAPAIHRVPLRPEERQRAHPAAISPDGELIAYGVPPERSAQGRPRIGTAVVYLLRRSDGEVLHRIDQGIPTRPQALRFSPDGGYLAAALSDGCGLRVWSTADWSLIARDDNGYGGPAGQGSDLCERLPPDLRDPLPDTPGLAFGRSSGGGLWLYTSGESGVRSYRAEGGGFVLADHKRPAEIALENPGGLAVSPDGGRLAVGDRRLRGRGEPVNLQVAVLDSETLAPAGGPLRIGQASLFGENLAHLDPRARPDQDQMSLDRVAWGRVDGKDYLFAGGVLWCRIVDRRLLLQKEDRFRVKNCLARWRLPPNGQGLSGASVAFVPVDTDRVMDLAFLPGGGALLYVTPQRLGAIDVEGIPVRAGDGALFLHRNRAADLRGRIEKGDDHWLDLWISDDAKRVYFEDYRFAEGEPIRLLFDLERLDLDRVAEPPPSVRRPDQDPVFLDPPANWRNRPAPPQVFGRRPSGLGEGQDLYRSAALDDRHRRALLGSDGFLRLVGEVDAGSRILCQRRITAEAYRVNLTPDGDLAVVGHADGVLRWYRIAFDGDTCTLEPLLAVHIRQVPWDPEQWTWIAWNPVTGSYAADAGAQDLTGYQITRQDGQIELVPFRRLLELYDRQAILSALDRPTPTEREKDRLRQAVEERSGDGGLEVESPPEGGTIDSERVRFELSLAEQGDWPRALVVSAGGIDAETAFLGRSHPAGEPVLVPGPGRVSLDVRVPASLLRRSGSIPFCFSHERVEVCRSLRLDEGVAAPRRRRLIALLIGISDYETEGLRLDYAHNDALDLARLFAGDYERRVLGAEEGGSRVAPDYEEISLHLVVAPATAAAAGELDRLAQASYVHRYQPSAEGVRKALAMAAEESAQPGSVGNLLLFFFSGHGIDHPYNRDRGRTAFLMPSFRDSQARANFEQGALTTDGLIDRLRRISAERLVVIDAGRETGDGLSFEATFDPGLIVKELESRGLDAYVFFSAKAHQHALEGRGFAYSTEREALEQGNGAFTYALLHALTDREAELDCATRRGEPAEGKIEICEMERFLRAFFSEEGGQGSAPAKRPGTDFEMPAQEPEFIFLPPALRSPSSVVRTLDRPDGDPPASD
jgi:hypothetical protein